MSALQVHLAIVHFPVVGMLFVVLLLGFGLKWGDQRLINLGKVVLIACGIGAVIAYNSGPGAYEILKQSGALTKEIAEEHALMGKGAFVGMILLAVVAGRDLLQAYQDEKPTKFITPALLVLSILMSVFLGYTAHEGGEIRRPELQGIHHDKKTDAPSQQSIGVPTPNN